MPRNLHSTMVRFIIRPDERSIKSVRVIYIPLWLDLLFQYPIVK